MPARFPDGIAGEVSGTGPHLLWGHGLTSSRADEDAGALFGWRGLPGATVVRWDAPGHGASRPAADDDDATWPRLGRLMLDVADAVGADRFVAGGASMGCATSLWAAVTAPERVRGLALAIPPTAWDTRAAQADVYRAGARLLETRGAAALADRLEEAPVPPALAAVAEERRAVRRAALLAADPVSLARVMRGAATSDLPAPDALRALEVPALVLAWTGDPGHPLGTAEALAGLLPAAQLHIAETLDDVRGWRELLAGWLARLP